MAKVSTYLDTRREKDGGKFPLKFSISYGRGVRILYPTGIDIEAKHWNGHEVVRHESRLRYNQLIGHKRLEIEFALLDAEARRVALNPASLKRVVENALSGRGKAASYPVADAFAAAMARTLKPSTQAIYQRCLDAIGAFTPLDGLMMRDIDYRWLCEFEAHLRKTSKTNTVSILMRSLRAVFNYSVRTKAIEADAYPFDDFKIKQEETPKRALTLEQLRSIREHGGKYADIFLLSFYLLGINICDLCRLKEITPDGRIEYRRSKTGKLYSVKVEPEARAIIEKYRGEKWLINVLDSRTAGREDHRTFMYNFNRRMKEIVPGISSYWARHTWATLAADNDVPIEVISHALGHSCGSPTTAIYIKFSQKKVDEANRKIIDHLNAALRQSKDGTSGSSTV